MDILEIMKVRHSVRQYSEKKIENGKREALMSLVKECNKESGMNVQIIFDEPKCFDSMMAHYGKFSGVENYIALVGKKDAGLDEKAGYYGEQLCNCASGMPDWFSKGMEAVRLAPTAMNQQKFYLTLENGSTFIIIG